MCVQSSQECLFNNFNMETSEQAKYQNTENDGRMQRGRYIVVFTAVSHLPELKSWERKEGAYLLDIHLFGQLIV